MNAPATQGSHSSNKLDSRLVNQSDPTAFSDSSQGLCLSLDSQGNTQFQNFSLVQSHPALVLGMLDNARRVVETYQNAYIISQIASLGQSQGSQGSHGTQSEINTTQTSRNRGI